MKLTIRVIYDINGTTNRFNMGSFDTKPEADKVIEEQVEVNVDILKQRGKHVNQVHGSNDENGIIQKAIQFDDNNQITFLTVNA